MLVLIAACRCSPPCTTVTKTALCALQLAAARPSAQVGQAAACTQRLTVRGLHLWLAVSTGSVHAGLQGNSGKAGICEGQLPANSPYCCPACPHQTMLPLVLPRFVCRRVCAAASLCQGAGRARRRQLQGRQAAGARRVRGAPGGAGDREVQGVEREPRGQAGHQGRQAHRWVCTVDAAERLARLAHCRGSSVSYM